MVASTPPFHVKHMCGPSGRPTRSAPAGRRSIHRPATIRFMKYPCRGDSSRTFAPGARRDDSGGIGPCWSAHPSPTAVLVDPALRQQGWRILAFDRDRAIRALLHGFVAAAVTELFDRVRERVDFRSRSPSARTPLPNARVIARGVLGAWLTLPLARPVIIDTLNGRPKIVSPPVAQTTPPGRGGAQCGDGCKHADDGRRQAQSRPARVWHASPLRHGKVIDMDPRTRSGRERTCPRLLTTRHRRTAAWGTTRHRGKRRVSSRGRDRTLRSTARRHLPRVSRETTGSAEHGGAADRSIHPISRLRRGTRG